VSSLAKGPLAAPSEAAALGSSVNNKSSAAASVTASQLSTLNVLWLLVSA
jgi:hypothetical protein